MAYKFELILVATILFCALCGWLTSLAFIDGYNCSSGSKEDYCKKYVSSGIGEIITNDGVNKPVAEYTYKDQLMKCNLYNANNDKYPVGMTFDINYKKGEPEYCVSDEYKYYYIDDRTKKAKMFNNIYMLPFATVYLFGFMIFHYIYVMEQIDKIRKQRNNNNNAEPRIQKYEDENNV